MRPPPSSGMTLIEVVAAIALLSALTVAILPLLVDATKALAPQTASVDPTGLRKFSETWLKGDSSVARLHPRDGVRVLWNVGGKQRTVAITRLFGAESKTIPHDWIRFSCGDVRVLRFLPRVDPAPTPNTGPSQ